jgi:hypothetical protein
VKAFGLALGKVVLLEMFNEILYVAEKQPTGDSIRETKFSLNEWKGANQENNYEL